MPPSKRKSSQSGLPRGFSLSGHCTGKSAVMPTPASKRGIKANTARHVSKCADVKTNAKLEKGVRRGRDGMSSLPAFRTPSQGRPCIYSEKASGESHEMGEVKPLKTEIWKHTHTFILNILFTQRVPPAGVAQYGFVQEHQIAEGLE